MVGAICEQRATALPGARSRARETSALLIVWGAWLVVMTGANLAAPLYATYAARYGFSSLVLTAIFATYALTLVPRWCCSAASRTASAAGR